MDDQCVKFEGQPHRYQEEAADRYVHVWQAPLGAYAWVIPMCGIMCLNVDHMRLERPRKLEYPHSVCVYCGAPGYTKDHLEPRTWTGDASRAYVVTVPACGECNTLINDSFAPTITARREIAKEGLKRKYKRVLARVVYSEEELGELEGLLRSAVISGMEERQYVLERLAWPEDPSYDLRALEKSGLPDAIITELAPHL